MAQSLHDQARESPTVERGLTKPLAIRAAACGDGTEMLSGILAPTVVRRRIRRRRSTKRPCYMKRPLVDPQSAYQFIATNKGMKARVIADDIDRAAGPAGCLRAVGLYDANLLLHELGEARQ